MQLEYKNRKIELVCTNAYKAEKKYGRLMAEKIQERVDEIKAAPSIEVMIKHRIGRCHPLKGERKNSMPLI